MDTFGFKKAETQKAPLRPGAGGWNEAFAPKAWGFPCERLLRAAGKMGGRTFGVQSLR
jgi:hypothetical protein